jgi:mannose-6-phosphate isomerase-like protein (cupin superfamily)
MLRPRVFLKQQQGAATTGFRNVHGPMRAVGGWGVLMLPPALDTALIPANSNTLVFYIVAGSMVAQLGDGLSKTTDMAVGRGWVIRAQPNNWFGFRNASKTHYAVAFYVHWSSS